MAKSLIVGVLLAVLSTAASAEDPGRHVRRGPTHVCYVDEYSAVTCFYWYSSTPPDWRPRPRTWATLPPGLPPSIIIAPSTVNVAPTAVNATVWPLPSFIAMPDPKGPAYVPWSVHPAYIAMPDPKGPAYVPGSVHPAYIPWSGSRAGPLDPPEPGRHPFRPRSAEPPSAPAPAPSSPPRHVTNGPPAIAGVRAR